MPGQSLQQACSPECAIELARQKQIKEQQRETRRKLKTRRDWLREAQVAFNAWIRFHDRDLPCISCGSYHNGQWHAGHYRSVGAAPALRFERLNVHKQCMPCNAHKSGNIVEYRIRLLHKIGPDAMEWLEGPHDEKRWTVEELKEIRDHYRGLLRKAEKAA